MAFGAGLAWGPARGWQWEREPGPNQTHACKVNVQNLIYSYPVHEELVRSTQGKPRTLKLPDTDRVAIINCLSEQTHSAVDVKI